MTILSSPPAVIESQSLPRSSHPPSTTLSSPLLPSSITLPVIPSITFAGQNLPTTPLALLFLFKQLQNARTEVYNTLLNPSWKQFLLLLKQYELKDNDLNPDLDDEEVDIQDKSSGHTSHACMFHSHPHGERAVKELESSDTERTQGLSPQQLSVELTRIIEISTQLFKQIAGGVRSVITQFETGVRYSGAEILGGPNEDGFTFTETEAKEWKKVGNDVVLLLEGIQSLEKSLLNLTASYQSLHSSSLSLPLSSGLQQEIIERDYMSETNELRAEIEQVRDQIREKMEEVQEWVVELSM